MGRRPRSPVREQGGPERRPLHSVLTGFVALVAAAAVVLPLTLTGGSRPRSTSPPAVGSSARWVVPPSAVRWTSAGYPITGGCGGNPVEVQQASLWRPPGGPLLALVLVRCDDGAELPPSSLFVYDGADSPTRPVLLATLLPRSKDMIVTGGLSTRGSAVTLGAAGYSSPDVPQCCPDVHTTLGWTWTGHGLRPEGPTLRTGPRRSPGGG